MPRQTLLFVLFLQATELVAAMAIYFALYRWKHSVWLKEQGTTARGFEVKVHNEKQA